MNPNTTRRGRQWLVQGNQNHLCGQIMRSNRCCDSHSTTRRVSCKKGSISSAARTQACSPPLLLLLIWDVAGFRGRRQEVEGWGDGVIVLESMQIHCPQDNRRAAFSNLFTLKPVFKKVHFQALCFQDLCGPLAKKMQYMCIFTKERFRVDCLLGFKIWMAAIVITSEKYPGAADSLSLISSLSQLIFICIGPICSKSHLMKHSKSLDQACPDYFTKGQCGCTFLFQQVNSTQFDQSAFWRLRPVDWISQV